MGTTNRTAKPPSGKKKWVMRIPPDAVDQTVGLSPRAFRLLFILEAACRTRFFCWNSNANLAKQLGCHERHVANCFQELEAAGWAERDYDGRGENTNRIIRMLRRLDPTMPVKPADWDQF